ncbi:MAG TPA: D-alanyl-D-alanine carboxypeptidase/D-alanyl-D-alanine-endopeptidase [Kofleriaceae bacterium]|nr:D-alanyl-D-alanine carboxypeptidase/D-alanyl-D-alanine-endopeptidase [Kofleriaceae bacterium]
MLLLVMAWMPDASAGTPSSGKRVRPPAKAGARRITRDSRSRTSPVRRSRTRSEPATPEGRLREELEGIWAGRILRRGVTAVYVVDARTGDDIYSVHPDDKLNPASNVKLVSTATVLDLLGPEWHYLTRLFGPAPDGKGLARGDVYLRGNGDPTLGRNSLEGLAADVARSGVKRIEGDVLLSDDLLRDTIAEPRIAVKVKAGPEPGAPPQVTVDGADGFVQVHVTAQTTTSRRARLEITVEPIVTAAASGETSTAQPSGEVRDGPRVLVQVGGTIRQGRSGTYWRSLGMRSTFTGYALRQALRTAGVEVTGGVRLTDFDSYSGEALAAGFLPIELGRHRSRSMNELVARVNKRSLNWLADRLLMTAGSEATGGGAPTMENGIEAMYRWLEQSGLDRKQIVVDTGSGLSHRTQLTARQLVKVLRAAAGFHGSKSEAQGLLDPAIYLASLAVGGVDGTLRGRFRGDSLRGRVVGKTGTLRDSVALSGFVSDEVGNALCFAIVTNGNRWEARGRIRREHEQMVAAMKRYLDARLALDVSRRADQATEVAKTAAPAEDSRESADAAEADEERQGSETSAGADDAPSEQVEAQPAAAAP